jgi:hypothetical protein
MGRLEGKGDANGSVRANEHDLSRLQTSLVMCGDYSADALKYDHHSMEVHERRMLIGAAEPTETASGHSTKRLRLSCVIANAMSNREE